jgi:UPF0271 protein
MPRRAIDLNADLGEGCPWDRALLDRVTSASIACGAHAGAREVALETIELALARGVTLGAHPGYADRANFGRVDQNLTHNQILALVRDQVEWLSELANQSGTPLRFVKPHGALYNQAHRDAAIATPLVDAVALRGLPILGMPGGAVEQVAGTIGLPFIAEGFADRRYTLDGRLVPRTEPNAILEDPDEIRQQVLDLVDRGIATLCLHGDNPRSVELADLVKATLIEAGITIQSFA